MKHLDTPQALLYYMMLIRGLSSIAEAFAYGKLAARMFHLSVGQEATIGWNDFGAEGRRLYSKPSPWSWSHDCAGRGYQENDGRDVRTH